MELQTNALDRLIGWVSPETLLRRLSSRAATNALHAHYEGGSRGRATQGWLTRSAGPNAASATTLKLLRDRSRDLARNNPWARQAIEDLETETVGVGILPKIKGRTMRASKALGERWRAHFETTDIDADGVHDIYGLQAIAFRTIAESGEVLIRRRLRRIADGFALPFQLQVLEPDHLDASRDVANADGSRIVGGIEFDQLGRRVAYWLFPEHPGETTGFYLVSESRRVPAESILHLYRVERPGQVRGVPWGASAIIRLRNFDEYEDAQLVRQKIAACFAVFIRKSGEGLPSALQGVQLDPKAPKKPPIEAVFPGLVEHLGSGDDVSFANPPGVDGYESYSTVVLRAIAAGYGTTYEGLTGDYSKVNLSSARIAGYRHARRIDAWRWRILIPRLCGPVLDWAFELADVMGLDVEGATATWAPPRRDLIDPKVEVVATRSEIRAGLKTLSAALRERGDDPDEVFEELAADAKRIDDLGLVLESDARRPSNGQPGDPANAQGGTPPKSGDTPDKADGEDDAE